MDWIRLGNSGKDLTGVGGRIRSVSPTELSLHNTQNNAWLAIRGRVYNITHYLPFHPGGSEELMRGAGMDATELFDKVHPWVNYDSLLAKCLVGPLSFDRPDADELFNTSSPKADRLREPSKAQELVRKSMENLANCITPVRKKITAKSEENVKGSPPSKIMQSLIQSSDLPVSISRRAAANLARKTTAKDTPPPVRYDWIQTSHKLILSIYTGQLVNPGGSARLVGGSLLIEIVTDGWLRTFQLNPEGSLREPLQLKVFAESGKVEVVAIKVESKVWKECGVMTLGDPVPTSAPRRVECRVLDVAQLSHDTSLLVLAAVTGPVIVPLGHHIRVHHQQNSECVRSYTPLGDGWDRSRIDLTTLKLAVKRYDSGLLSPYLTSLKIGDLVTLSGPYGTFQLHKLKSVKTVYFIAAGTGITPMLGLMRFMLSRSNPRCESLNLLFFNKTEDDILFKEHFEGVAQQDDRLKVFHILSNPSSPWQGMKGRICMDTLCQIIDQDSIHSSEDGSHFACLCGPTEFTYTGLDLLNKIGFKESFMHAFIG
ncbi:cytochrome b5 reductase 4 isoform X3 [Leptidea sinapis]|nr:cytochrome b5 reductase 4 isoform X3 [Leptidea sinapis]